ncbi:MAG TPA: efflux transporter outer membrane subunit [Gemmatimonadales bacterium]|nr:efflux transporter outer membrane subunit [Gemmatimonadales bacterium]
MTKRAVGLVLAALAMLSCKVGPGYERPEVAVPETYRFTDTTVYSPDSLAKLDSAAATIADVPWWQVFGDDTLQTLINEGIQHNYNLGIAIARVQEARAITKVAGSALWPQVAAEGGGDRSQITRPDANALNQSRVTNRFFLDGVLSWELDLFGRVRRQKESAEAQFFATEFAQRGTIISVVTGIADAYFTLRGLDEQLDIARKTVDSRRETVELFRRRELGGVSNRMEVSQAEADLYDAIAAQLETERLIALQETVVSLLLGRGPGPIPRGTTLSDQSLPPDVPPGIPSSLLERRPDVREAEELMRSANADIGVAMADYFPRISLTGLFGWVSPELDKLLSEPQTVWSVGGSIIQPIFTGGRIKGNVQAARARWVQSANFYLGTAQSAFGEVSDALLGIRYFKNIAAQRDSQVTALAEGSKLTLARYEAGRSNYLEVLDVDRRLFVAETQEVQARLDHARTYIALYRALGGGWQVPDTAATTDSTSSK